MKKTQLKTAQLGATGLEITRVGLGAWAIGGGGYDWGWGTQEDDDSIAAIHHAVELGVNWIDTAAQYGFGQSEEVVGRALRELGEAERPYVFTKAGQPEGPNRTTLQSLRRDSLRRELEGSLQRLGLEAVDLYQIHWPIPDEEIEEGWTTFAELKEEGLVRHIGVSNFDVAQLRRAQAIAANNVINAAAIVFASVATMALIAACVSVSELFLLTGGLTVVVAFLSWRGPLSLAGVR